MQGWFWLVLLLPWAWAQGVTVRVLLEEVPQGREVVLELPGGPVRALLGGEGLVVEGRLFPYYLALGPFRYRGAPYRGEVYLLPQGGRLLVVNRLPLEEYLLGVLPFEMPDTFPLEALKAQAILARTFAVHRLRPEAAYDLCASYLCQVYRGAGRETPRVQEAVAATRGLVVSYGGRAISALYHADSGGHTAGSEEVFQEARPYLRPRPDPFTRAQAWQVEVSRAKALEALRVLGYRPQGEEPPQVLARTPSGRVARLRVMGVEVFGPPAQRLLRALGLPSALVEGFQGWTALGRGSGHGVGLSQWGARGMAERGYTYREILGYYFPGTFLSELVFLETLPQALWSWSPP